MTEHGICHNANYREAQLTISDVGFWKPVVARTIVYYDENMESWRTCLENLMTLSDLGVKNLVVFNTEASGCDVDALGLRASRLDQFLNIARSEYNSCVHRIESDNEIDTKGWTLSNGTPIDSPLGEDIIIRNAHNFYDVALGYNVEVIGPSFLGGHLGGMAQHVITKFAEEGKIKSAVFHPYGRSIMGKPSEEWIWGSVEQLISDLETYLPSDMYIDFTEIGIWTIQDGYGDKTQTDYVGSVCRFEHPKVRSICYFANSDLCTGAQEYADGRDFGLKEKNGIWKPSAYLFHGMYNEPEPEPEPESGPTYKLGFEEFYNKLISIGVDPGNPLENEWGPHGGYSIQQTQNGTFIWFGLSPDNKLTYLHRGDGRRFRINTDTNKVETIKNV